MQFRDTLLETFFSLAGNKIRSGLTMLGIVIGIASVIVLVGVGQGATASITSNISSLGSNLIMVTPGSTSSGGVRSASGNAQTLTQDDARAIAEGVGTVSTVASVVSSRSQVIYKSSNTNSQIIGTESGYADVRNLTMETGDFLTVQNVKTAAKVAVLGSSVRDDLFGEGVDPVGQTIKINKVQFKVVGVTAAKGGSSMSDSTDDTIYVPLAAAQRYLSGSSSSIGSIYIKAVDEDSVTQAQTDITDLLLARHNIADSSSADFQVRTQADIISSVSSVSQTLTILLGAIAGISLLVGGIGIMNMMLTTVTERTREIGLRKAIGAKSKDITSQFLSESVALTFLSGIIGVALGWGVAAILTGTGVVTSIVTWQSIALSFGISALIGIVFGLYPANKAAQLKPIEALKYE